MIRKKTKKKLLIRIRQRTMTTRKTF